MRFRLDVPTTKWRGGGTRWNFPNLWSSAISSMHAAQFNMPVESWGRAARYLGLTTFYLQAAYRHNLHEEILFFDRVPELYFPL
ncbi:hypothetical protein [Pseudomonas sp.]|uniref:hypothetical protein n=1 Tax=Pseudomonas sp. TaxID=306 RepID=UPI0019EE41BE|nr:hypothetical protein [Pseudomonas sp.]MBF0673627.1 hypothetical protein [Pseudomonas sp.]